MTNIEDLIVDCSISYDHINIVLKDDQNEEEQKAIHDFLTQLAINICTKGESLE